MIRLKNKRELEGIKKSCKVLAETFEMLRKHIKEGVSTQDLDKLAFEFISRQGGTPAFLGYNDYPASICASINQVVIHGIPNAYKLKSGDILSLDLGIILDGYFSDAAKTYIIGTASHEVTRLLKVTEECLGRAIAQAQAGNRIHDISHAVYNHAIEHGYGVVHQFCGHGVGLSLHEDPQIPNYIGAGPNPRLKPGMVLAIEPMVNIGSGDVRILDDDWTVVTVDNSLSAHFEHTIALFQDHTEILTTPD